MTDNDSNNQNNFVMMISLLLHDVKRGALYRGVFTIMYCRHNLS